MNEESKFCPNCGQEMNVEEKFCPSCGFNFETREVPENDETEHEQTQTTSEQKTFDFKKLDFKNFDFKDFNFKDFDLKNLSKKQLGIIGGVIVGLLLLVFLFTGNISIAGTYESEDTLGDPEYEALFEISRNGKTDIIISDHYEGYSFTLTIYLTKNGENSYIADTSKGLDIEGSVANTLNDSASLIDTLPMELNTLGFEVENTGNGLSVTGSLTEIEAIDAGMDLRDIYIVEHGENLMFDGELLIKR